MEILVKIITLRLSLTNDYLFANKTKWILVDTGYAEDWEIFKKRLEGQNIKISQISHLILTHHHDDHAGFINELIEANPDIIVVMSELTRELLLVGMNDITHGGGIINRRIKTLLDFKQFYVTLKSHKKVSKSQNLVFKPYIVRTNDIILEGETRLADIGVDVGATIFPSPGHTIDSISILFDDGDCIVGDAAANFLNFAGAKYCVVFVRDLDEYYDTWRDLLARGTKRILPAHGPAFPSERLAKNLGKNKIRNMIPIDLE
jgi:glyoxylase-like metal-dependent hydrolase (beta-lactamase superfamily II)